MEIFFLSSVNICYFITLRLKNPSIYRTQYNSVDLIKQLEHDRFSDLRLTVNSKKRNNDLKN